MGLMSGIAGGILRQMPIVDARHQRDTENERADIKQKMWLAQQKRQQDEYERLAKERIANNYVSMHPNIARGLLSGKITEVPPEMQGASNIFTVGNTVSPPQKFEYDMALKRAGAKPNLKLTTVMKDGVPMRAIVNLDTGEESLIDKAPPTNAPSASVTMPGVNKFKMEEGKRASAYLGDLSKQSNAATDIVNILDRLEAIEAGGFKSGLLTPAKAWLAKGMETFGLDPTSIGLDKAKSYEEYKAITQRYVFDLLKQQKGVQTEGDAKRAQQAFVDAANTGQGNVAIRTYYKKLQQRLREKQRFVLSRINEGGTNLNQIELQWQDYIEKNPLFPPEPKNNPAQAGVGLSDDDLETIFNNNTKQPLQR